MLSRYCLFDLNLDTALLSFFFPFVLRAIALFHPRADDLASDFGIQGIPVQSLHGNREQCDREQALDDFKKGEFVLKYWFV